MLLRKNQKHGEFVGIAKEISQNILMFVEKGTAEIEGNVCARLSEERRTVMSRRKKRNKLTRHHRKSPRPKW